MSTPPPPTPDAKFSGIKVTGTDVVVEWTGTGTLQSADLVVGPWTDVVGATSPRSVAKTSGPKYYRFAGTDKQLSVTLSGAAERPNAVITAGTGSGFLTVKGNTLTYSITFSGLSGPDQKIKGLGYGAAKASIGSGEENDALGHGEIVV